MAPDTTSSTSTTISSSSGDEQGDMEEGSSSDPDEEDEGFKLKSLPNEILEKIFTSLDLRTWRSMRQVCKRFKALADTKEALANFKVSLRAKKLRQLPHLQSITDSVPWTHLSLDHYDSSDLQQGSLVLKGLEKLGKALKTRALLKGVGLRGLECRMRSNDTGNYCNYNSMKPFLIHCSQSLESLGVLRMTEIKNRLLKVEENIGSFPKLRDLRLVFDMDGEYEGKELLSLLNLCPNLRRLELMFPDQDEHPMTVLSFESAVLTPILSYLDQRALSAPPMPSSFTINFTSEAYRCSIPFGFRSLWRLMLISNVNLYLEGVPFLALPTKRELLQAQAESNPQIIERMNNSVKSITGTMQDLKISTMEIERDSFHSSCRHMKPSTANFSLVIYLPSGNKVYLTPPCQLLPLDIQSITIISENKRACLLLTIGEDDWDEVGRRSFVENLLTHPRPGLKELKIVTETDQKLELPFLTQDSVNFKHFDGFKNFPNLKVLHLHHWGRTQQDFWDIYKSTPLLEELELRKCYRLKDEGIIGDGEEGSLVQLKNLKRLTLDGFWSITDASFIQAFSQIGLESLIVFDDPDKDKSLTMKSIHSLRNSKCGETLKYLKINKPFKSSLKDVRKALISCRSLKQVELLEDAGAGSKTAKNVISF